MCCRFVLVLLLMCVADSKARVVDSFAKHCKDFFYKGIVPQINNLGKKFTARGICQRYGNQDHFATVYMPEYRIPLYSAYRLDNFSCEYHQNPRLSEWFIEPELSNIFGDNMDNEYKYEYLKASQAVNVDYTNTGYDRGHLNPRFYQCDDARTATFTLTNAVPQDPCLNRQHWFEMEKVSKQIMFKECNSPGAKRYFITGVIPSDTSIPFTEHDDKGDKQGGFNRVNVPFAMWTAACCEAPTETESFSFDYYAYNRPDSVINVSFVPFWLSFYGLKVQLFADNCFQSSAKSKTALDMLTKASNRLNAHTSASENTEPFYSVYRMSTP